MNKKTHQVKGESCIQKTHLSLQLVYHGLCIPPKRISQFWKKNRSRRTLPSDNHSLQCRFVPYHILARLALEMAPNRRPWPFLNENIFSHSAMRPPKSTVDSPNIFACFSSNWSKDSLKKTSRKFSTFSNAREIQKFNSCSVSYRVERHMLAEVVYCLLSDFCRNHRRPIIGSGHSSSHVLSTVIKNFDTSPQN